MEIVFKLNNTRTKWGEKICVVGNHQDLGNWMVS